MQDRPRAGFGRMQKWLRGFISLIAVTLGLHGATAQAQTVYYHNDTAGSPIAATDETGNLLWRESYRPYGDRMLKPAAANTQWFHGKSLDPDTGMEDFGARNYDPVLGRFLSIDPLDFQDKNIHSFNRYAYGNNNPLKFKDPDGRQGVGINSFPNIEGEMRQYQNALVDVYKQAVLFVVTDGVAGVGTKAFQIWRLGKAAETLKASTGVQNSSLLEKYLNTSGGRWGGTSTRLQNDSLATALEDAGWKITGGAGRYSEEWIAGAGGGAKGGSWVDITATKGKSIMRVQTVTTMADGVTLTPTEAAAAKRIQAAFPHDALELVPKW